MRIGFDAKRAFMNHSGLGNYSRTLMLSLLEQFPENEYVAFTPARKDELGAGLIDSPKLKLIYPPEMMKGVLSSVWRSSFVSRDISAQRLDIFHGLSNELPKGIHRPVKKFVTIHDLIFLRHPKWYPFLDRNVYYKKVRKACKDADVVIAVSEHTKTDIRYYFNTPAEKIKVVYQSCDDAFSVMMSEKEKTEFRNNQQLPERYVLYVGTIEERKDLLTLVKALAKDEEKILVVIGKKKKHFEKVQQFINENNLQPRVLFKENVNSENIPFYFQCAALFVYPSLYEGFGIPVIEALAAGIPVIAANATALPEAGGPSSVYFQPGDENDLAGKINLVWNDAALRQKMVADGKSHVTKFDRKKAAVQLMEHYSASLQS